MSLLGSLNSRSGRNDNGRLHEAGLASAKLNTPQARKPGPSGFFNSVEPSAMGGGRPDNAVRAPTVLARIYRMNHLSQTDSQCRQ